MKSSIAPNTESFETTTTANSPSKDNPVNHQFRRISRYALGAILISAGIGHLSWARTSFQSQVPRWVPGDLDTIVLLSGVVEIGLGTTLICIRSKWIGWVVGAFFIAVFPGNISQYVNHRDAFGLNTDTRRAVRLIFQPLLVAWALWSTNQKDQRSRRRP